MHLANVNVIVESVGMPRLVEGTYAPCLTGGEALFYAYQIAVQPIDALPLRIQPRAAIDPRTPLTERCSGVRAPLIVYLSRKRPQRVQGGWIGRIIVEAEINVRIGLG